MAKGITVDLIVDPKGAIKGLSQVEGKSVSVAGVMGKLGSAAATGLIALGTAALAAVTGLTAATKSAGEYAENVELAASKTHLSTDAVQELQYASKISGVSFETIQGSLTKLTKSVGQAASGNKAAAGAFDELGVSTVDANGNLRDSTDIYSDVIDALGQVSNPTERDILAMQLLGKSATNLNPLIDGTAGSLTDLKAQAHDAGAVLSGDMLNGLGDVDDAFDKLSAGTDAAKNALGLVLMPALTELGDTGSGLLGQFTTAVVDANGDLSKAAPEIGKVFGDAAKFLISQIPAFLSVGTSIVTAILLGIATQGPDLITAAVPVLIGFVTTLLGQLPLLLDAGAKILIALVTGVADALPTLIPAAVDAVIGLVTALVDNLPLLLDAGLQLISGLATGLIAAVPTLIAALPGLILGLVTFLLDAVPQIIDTGITLITSLVTALPDIINQIVEVLPTLIVSIVTALLEALPQLIDAGVTLLTGLIGALPVIITTLVSATPQIITGLVKAFTSPATLKKLGDAGMQIVKGLFKGIQDTGDWLIRQIFGFFDGVIDAIKALLGIHSPSTVFAGIGANMIQGLAKGITGSAGLAVTAMSDISDQVQSGFTGAVSVQAQSSALVASGGSALGGGATIVNNYTFPAFLGGDKSATRRAIDDLMRGGRQVGDVSQGWATS